MTAAKTFLTAILLMTCLQAFAAFECPKDEEESPFKDNVETTQPTKKV